MRRLVSILLAVLVGVSMLSGGAIAQTATPTDSSMTILDESVSPSENTQTVWYEVVAADDLGGDTLDATVTFEGLESGQEAGNGTELATETISVSTGGEATTGSYSLADSDAETYETIRIEVDGDASSDVDLVNTTDYGTTERLSGGGGGILPSTGSSAGAVVAVLALLGIGLYARD